MKAIINKKLNNSKGFTLPELLISVFILVVAFIGLMFSFIKSIELVEIAKNSSNAMVAVKSRLEQIKNTPFNQLVPTYNNVNFTDSNVNGIGISYVDNSNADLYVVTISFCWRQKSGRIIGEDTNLNGQLDVGEDQDGNGIIDSIVEITSEIYDK